MKTCTTCKEEKLESEFYKDSQKPDGIYSNCKTCHIARCKQYELDHPEVRIATRYGISRRRAKEILDIGFCEICGVTEELHVDHDHKKGRGYVRGLLCRGCNLGLGNFEDNSNRILEALSYLRNRNA